MWNTKRARKRQAKINAKVDNIKRNLEASFLSKEEALIQAQIDSMNALRELHEREQVVLRAGIETWQKEAEKQQQEAESERNYREEIQMVVRTMAEAIAKAQKEMS